MSPEAFRLLAAFIGIVLLVLLVARLKWHPFLALMFISWGLAVTCGIDPAQAFHPFSRTSMLRERRRRPPMMMEDCGSRPLGVWSQKGG